VKDFEKLIIGAAAAAGLYLLIANVFGGQKVALPGASSRTPLEDNVMRWATLIWTHALTHNVEPALIASVVAAESSGNPEAQGAAGEVGLMQVLPSTAKGECGLQTQELFEPQKNIACGVAYLKRMLDLYTDPSVRPIYAAFGLAAYNAGPARVFFDLTFMDWSVPQSTREYVARVLAAVPRFRELFQELPQYREYEEFFPADNWSVVDPL